MSERRDEIKRKVDTDRGALCRALGMREDGAGKDRWWCPLCQCDGRQHEDGDFSSKEGFKCFKCDWKGDAFDLVMCVKGGDFPVALDFAGEVYGVPGTKPTAKKFDFDGCTLAEFAAAKRLPIPFLKDMGVSEFKMDGKPVLRFPYHLPDGIAKAARLRFNLTGRNKHRWRKSDKPLLYGLARVGMAHKAGYIIIVEGESDSLTCWHHDFPAIGLPGAGGWKEERDAHTFQDIEIIYVVIEPDTGGEAVKKWLATSSIRLRVWLLDLDEHKDPSELYLADPEGFRDNMQAAMDRAVPWSSIEAEQRQEVHAEAWAKCKDIATAPEIMPLVVELAEKLGLVGESRLVGLVYLAVTSRLFSKPISVAIKGPSGSGKSFLVETVLRMFPASAYHSLTAMSEHMLAYSEEPLKHRHLCIFEAAGMDGDMQSYLVRTLLSEGRIRYETVESTFEGLKPRLIEREGPTGLLVTTTRAGLHPENETRLLSITVTDTRAQTAAILRQLAIDASGDPPDPKPWHAFQEWLATGTAEVVIPFGERLAGLIPPVAVRLRRDFSQLLSLIRAHALLHQHNRERDSKGRIVATPRDYEVVRDLVAETMAEGVEATVPPAVRETVQAVDRLRGDDGVFIKALADALNLDRSAAYRRFDAARKRGFLKNLETKRGRAIRADLADTMPDDIEILPPVTALAEGVCSCASALEGVKPPPPPTGTDQAATDMVEVRI